MPKLKWWAVAILVMAAGIALCLWFRAPSPVTLEIGRNTTYLLAPLSADGTVDYVARSTTRWPRVLTPNNNAAVQLVGRSGADAFAPDSLQKLGIKESPKAPHFISIHDYLVAHLPDTDPPPPADPATQPARATTLPANVTVEGMTMEEVFGLNAGKSPRALRMAGSTRLLLADVEALDCFRLPPTGGVARSKPRPAGDHRGSLSPTRDLFAAVRPRTRGSGFENTAWIAKRSIKSLGRSRNAAGRGW